jgi:hypothetical protein
MYQNEYVLNQFFYLQTDSMKDEKKLNEPCETHLVFEHTFLLQIQFTSKKYFKCI